MNTVLNAISKRRSQYAISPKSPISEARVSEIVKTAVKYVPSAFNSQQHRVIVLFGEQNHKLWEITKEELKMIVPADQFGPTEQKINSFQNSFGTVVFFEENSVVTGLAEQFPTYAHNFPIWSEQSNGMLQSAIWNALAEEGLGASLQHYNEVISDSVKSEWNIPASWRMVAQMPFGAPVAEPGEKAYPDADAFVKIYQ
ncbi:MAG: nitroreductase family protein [Clostridiaceae bacterium]